MCFGVRSCVYVREDLMIAMTFCVIFARPAVFVCNFGVDKNSCGGSLGAFLMASLYDTTVHSRITALTDPVPKTPVPCFADYTAFFNVT